ncbi:hypothetical protein ZWY2020_033015, partial [Hordeum vulgare]
DNFSKTRIDAVALSKHAHVHGKRQYVCQEPGCGKGISDKKGIDLTLHLYSNGQNLSLVTNGLRNFSRLWRWLKSSSAVPKHQSTHISDYQSNERESYEH